MSIREQQWRRDPPVPLREWRHVNYPDKEQLRELSGLLL